MYNHLAHRYIQDEMHGTRAVWFPAIVDTKVHHILVTRSVWLEPHHHPPVVLQLLGEKDLFAFAMKNEQWLHTLLSISEQCQLNSALAFVQP